VRSTFIAATAAAALIAAACSGSNNATAPPASPAAAPAPAAPAQETVTNNSIVTQISHPDEAMKSLASVAQPGDWKAYVNAGTAVSGSEKLKIAAALGMQAANGIAAEYAGDDASAEKLAASVKALADRLTLKSAALETLVAKTNTDLKEPDAARRSALVRADMAQLQDELKATFDRLGDGAAATMMVFGAWVEGVRMTASLLQAKYTPDASDALNRRNEAEYFLAAFSSAPAGADPLYAQLTPGLAKLRDAMAADKSHHLDKAAVTAIQAAATDLSGLLRK
jgi:hypothetical protein